MGGIERNGVVMVAPSQPTTTTQPNNGKRSYTEFKAHEQLAMSLKNLHFLPN